MFNKKLLLIISLSLLISLGIASAAPSFEENSTWQSNITEVQQGSTNLGDIDNDGDLDLILIGVGVSNHAKVYTNNGTTFNENTTWQNNLTNMYKSSTNCFE